MEKILKINLQDGTYFEFTRQNRDIYISRLGQDVKLPKASGRQVLDLVWLLEPFGHIEEEDNES